MASKPIEPCVCPAGGWPGFKWEGFGGMDSLCWVECGQCGRKGPVSQSRSPSDVRTSAKAKWRTMIQRIRSKQNG